MEYTLLKPGYHIWWFSKMQSGREDTLEERYAIKFCFKLGKLTQKHMECFRLLFNHLAWIEHQFLSAIKDSRKAGSLWGMMRSMGGVKKSNTRVDGTNWCQCGNCTIIREELKKRKICVKFDPWVLRKDEKERRCHDSREMVELIIQIPQFLMLWWPAIKAGSAAMTQRPRDRVLQWKHAGSPRPKKDRQSKSIHKRLMVSFWTALAWSTCTGFSLDRQSTRNTMFEQDGNQDSSSPSL